jgi:hypothetical protein
MVLQNLTLAVEEVDQEQIQQILLQVHLVVELEQEMVVVLQIYQDKTHKTLTEDLVVEEVVDLVVLLVVMERQV